MKSRIAPFQIMLAGILWGSMGLFVRKLNDIGLDAMELVALRAISTSVIMLLIIGITNRKFLKIKIRDVWCFLGTGIMSVILFNYCYFKAIEMTSLSVAAILLYTSPVFVMILSSILFKERITTVKVLAIVLTVLGCAMVSGVLGANEHISLEGFVMGLGAGFGYALYSIFGRYAIKRNYHSQTITFYTFVVAGIASIWLADVKKVGDSVVSHPKSIVIILLWVIISTVIPYMVYTMGLKYVENSKAAVIASIEPIAATLIGWRVFDEIITRENIVGMVMVLVAIIACSKKSR